MAVDTPKLMGSAAGAEPEAKLTRSTRAAEKKKPFPILFRKNHIFLPSFFRFLLYFVHCGRQALFSREKWVRESLPSSLRRIRTAPSE
jgi:hypothetical protein